MKSSEQRRHLAFEAARLMAREGITDVARARHKAAQRLGITDKNNQPDSDEILQQLREYQRLHGTPRQGHELRRIRVAAMDAMSYFKRFDPRLTGSVLEGTANAASAVLLHLHADDAESVPRFLADAAIPAQSRFRRLRLDAGRSQDFPAWTFIADGQAFELLVLPATLLRQAPLDADGKPMRRASLATLRTDWANDGEPGALPLQS